MNTLHFFRHGLLGLLLLWMLASPAHSSSIYAFVDNHGKLHVASQKTDVRFKRFEPTRPIAVKASAHKTSWIATRMPSRLAPRPKPDEWKEVASMPIHHKAEHYSPLINDIAEETGVNANLLHAIIQVESAYNPQATSPKGARGLMQLIPATAERFGVERSYDPAANVRGGARYIKNLLALFNNNIQLALAAYNAGEGSVQKYNNTIPPYPETQAYVSRVLALFEQREQ